ncbi:hypothetical protein [Teredinibacter sp. KSP-S5-2]|uniref:hypothetical protein n=1 Tax=Teredinibacter sp. KSP-S5-2 TaxID=3034506 RepID=UPI002934675F|nr:hypothetical protein [Teredinibacter sp. KSP-S5-2]WNO07791.1 hypothetical protein P5V12_12405 [Teredinibacter sp. KSP-S5-2]
MLTLKSENHLNNNVARILGLGLQVFPDSDYFVSKANDVRKAVLHDQLMITYEPIQQNPQSFVCWALVNDQTFDKIKQDEKYVLSGCEWFEGFNLVIYCAHLQKDNPLDIKREILDRVKKKIGDNKIGKVLVMKGKDKTPFECDLSKFSRL